MLRVERIKVSYDEVPAWEEVSFKVEAGQIVSIVGANGAAKSIDSLFRPTSLPR